MDVRPTYENQDTKAAEELTIQKVADRYRVEYAKLPVQYRVDWALLRNGVVACWCECKRRHNERAKYPTLILSLAKFTHGLDLARHTGLPFLLVVEWSDGIGHWSVETLSDLKIRIGGRSDRGDPQDLEPIVDIPIGLFTMI